MYELDSASCVRSGVICDGLYEFVLAIMVGINVVQGVNFNSGNFKINCLYNSRWNMAWRIKRVWKMI